MSEASDLPDEPSEPWLREGLQRLAAFATVDDDLRATGDVHPLEPIASRRGRGRRLVVATLAVAAALALAWLLAAPHHDASVQTTAANPAKPTIAVLDPASTAPGATTLITRDQALAKARIVAAASLDTGAPSIKRSTAEDLRRAGGPALPAAIVPSTPIWVVAATIAPQMIKNAATGDTWGVLVLDAATGEPLTIVTGGAADRSTWPAYFGALVDQS